MSNNNSALGSKIKGIRESRNLSVEEIAESSGLTVDQINSIENDENLPSLGPLIKIARAMGVRLGTFMDDNDALGPVICRAKDREKESSMAGQPLFPCWLRCRVVTECKGQTEDGGIVRRVAGLSRRVKVYA
jgi:transcriptional regulator with XRE-family HTH domain